MCQSLEIIKALNTNSSFWVDGNIALNQRGGPSWVGKYAVSTIMTDEADPSIFFKNPSFYTIGQVSKFIQPNALVHRHKPAQNTAFKNYVEYAVADNPDGVRVAVFSNRHNETLTVNYFDADNKQELAIDLEAESVQTIYYSLR